MAQFLEIKAANPDCMLFYRMGDFYELFFEDAVAAAQALGIVLTKRGKHLGEDIPMCGVPIHRADEYLQRLIRQGFRVAVCEQLEDPAEARKRGSKAVVRRDVVRLVTPGTLTEDSLLDAKARNYLTAVFMAAKAPARGRRSRWPRSTSRRASSRWARCRRPTFPGEIVRLSPSEVIAGDQAAGAHAEMRKWMEIAGAAATPVAGRLLRQLGRRAAAEGAAGRRRSGRVRSLLARGAGGRRRAPQVRRADPDRQEPLPAPAAPDRARRSPRHRRADASEPRAAALALRATAGQPARRHRPHRDGAGCARAGGRLASPLRDPQAIAARLDAVGFLLERDCCATICAVRAVCPGARHRPLPRRALPCSAAVRAIWRPCAMALAGRRLCPPAARRRGRLSACRHAPQSPVACRLAPSTCERSPAALSTIAAAPARRRLRAAGFRADLDEARALRDDNRKVMAALEAQVRGRDRHQPSRSHNNILGFYIEAAAGAPSLC